MIHVLVTIGTRPEAVKLSPVIRSLRRRPESFDCQVCLTGQHRDLVQPILNLFSIEPNFNLDVMTPGQSPAETASRILSRMDGLLDDLKPDIVLVQGDTVSVLATAVAAFYRKISVGHVEAGLRTGDRNRPFPEEMHRRLAADLANVHFAPTERARRHLVSEGIDDSTIHITGNTVVDALHWMMKSIRPGGPIDSGETRKVVLVTLHRRESFGAPMQGIFRAIAKIARDFPDVLIVFPVHPNPAVKRDAERLLGNISNIRLSPPLDYLDFIGVMKRARLILTDSGGAQEEAPTLGVPVLVLRETTERPELIEAGGGLLVGVDEARVYSEVARLLSDEEARRRMTLTFNPFGDGRAAERIAEVLLASSAR